MLEHDITHEPYFDQQDDGPAVWQQDSDAVQMLPAPETLQIELFNGDGLQDCGLQSSAWAPRGQHWIPPMATWKAREANGFVILCMCLFTFVMVCAVLTKCVLFSCFTIVVRIWSLYASWCEQTWNLACMYRRP